MGHGESKGRQRPSLRLDLANARIVQFEEDSARFTKEISGVQDALGENWISMPSNRSTAATVRKVCDALDEAYDRIKKFDDAFALIGKMLKFGQLPEEPEGKARACVSVIEAILGGLKITNERAEKQATIIDKLREFVNEWEKVRP